MNISAQLLFHACYSVFPALPFSKPRFGQKKNSKLLPGKPAAATATSQGTRAETATKKVITNQQLGYQYKASFFLTRIKRFTSLSLVKMSSFYILCIITLYAPKDLNHDPVSGSLSHDPVSLASAMTQFEWPSAMTQF